MKSEIGLLAGRHPELDACLADIERATEIIIDAYRSGGKVLVCGNGGSAADAEHICGELLKSFKRKRPVAAEISAKLSKELVDKLEGSLPAVSLVSMSGIVTAFANDVGWETAFAQQVLGLANAGDVLIALSTSGNSADCVAAAEVMKAKGGHTIALTGAADSALSKVSEVAIRVPASETYAVQELHLPVYHAICAAVEEELTK